MEKVECIVVGGGLAGLAAAYGLARDGVEVMVLERGNYSGAKNVTGGRLYARALRHIFPELWDDAPFERPVAHELITLLGDGAATTVELASQRLAGPPPQSYTVQRARFDQWFADKATAAGAMVVTDMKADELLLDGDRVIGVRAGGDEVGADVTIVAEGVLGLLASGAGLREQPRPADHAVGFKEIIELPAGVIEDRWRLNEGEGAAQLFMGEVSRGMTGGGFLYTNRDSIALGVVVAMDQLRTRIDGLESWQLFDAYKETAQIKPLVRGGTLAEYSAHAVFEGGADRLPRPWGAGYLLAGETAGLGRGGGGGGGGGGAPPPPPPPPPATRRPPRCRSTSASCARPSSRRPCRPAAACRAPSRTAACSPSTPALWRACSKASSRSTKKARRRCCAPACAAPGASS
jgi:electron transfer flavoprotein-quinone oxidoreductase